MRLYSIILFSQVSFIFIVEFLFEPAFVSRFKEFRGAGKKTWQDVPECLCLVVILSCVNFDLINRVQHLLITIRAHMGVCPRPL